MPKSEINVNRFVRELIKSSDAEIASAEEEMREYKKAQLARAREEYERQSRRYVKREIEKGCAEISAQLSKKHLRAREELVRRRGKMTDEIIAAAGVVLLKFTKTEQYLPLLEKTAAVMGEKLHSNRVILYVKPDDVVYSDAIKKAFGKFCRIEVDKSIEIGGIRGYDSILYKIIDETLDEKLLCQREYFADHSRLTIALR